MLGLLCGCSTSRVLSPNPPPAGAAQSEAFHLIVARPPGNFGWAVRLIVKLDGKNVALLKNGGHVELDLTPGNYVLSSAPGKIVGRSFPPAVTQISGRPGETKCFYYEMTFGPSMGSYFVNNSGIEIKYMTTAPEKAEWEERDPKNPERQSLAWGHQKTK